MEQTNSVNADPDPTSESMHSFLLILEVLGLCNNFAYVVMLSAAHDILKKQENQNSTATVTSTLDLQAGNSSNTSIYDCNPTSTAAVLLADILPTLFIKMFAPFVIHKFPYGFRILFCGLTAAASFLVVSFSSALWMSFLGVILASISSGLGELSFLALTVYYSRDVVGGWGSGTGAAGVTGALMYSGLTQLGLTPRLTLLIMLIIPAAMVLNYFFLLVHPPSLPQWRTKDPRCPGDEGKTCTVPSSSSGLCVISPCPCAHEQGLLKFVLPLGLVYFAEYFINQGLMELLYFPDFFLSHAEQYRWYQTLYQVGVFISRSSLCCFKVRKLWVFAALQFLNTVLLMFAVWFRFMPSAWIVFVIILYEGLLGGGAYVNTFYFISKETEERHREFAMALASVGDTMGICLSTALSFPVHNYFCTF
uniref:Battenin n=1 Tax=Periophthalmus magnuspinnatus TaxID=409849 RepID=A0A3B3ZN45_9GOBI